MKKLYFNILVAIAVITGSSYMLYMVNSTIRTQFDGIGTHLKVLVTHAGQRACRFLGCGTCPVKPSEPGYEIPSPPPPACGELNQSCGTANKFGVVKMCCGDLACVDKICKAPEVKPEIKPVIEKPAILPPPPTPACVELNQNCAINKKCCGDLVCLDNNCKLPEPACIELNQNCFENKKCCGEATCIDNFCRPKAPDLATRPFGAPAVTTPPETPIGATLTSPITGPINPPTPPAPTPIPVTIVPAVKPPITGPAIPTATPADSLFKKPDYTRPASMLSETPMQAGTPTPTAPPISPTAIPVAPAPGSPALGVPSPATISNIPGTPAPMAERPSFGEPPMAQNRAAMGPTGLTPIANSPENFEHPGFNGPVSMANRPAMGLTPTPIVTKPVIAPTTTPAPKPVIKTNKPDAGPAVFSNSGNSIPILKSTKNENIDLTLSPFEQQCSSLGVDYKYCSIYVYSADAPDGIALEGCYDTVVCEAIATT